MKTILVTGVAGFIGSFVGQRLLDKNYRVIGVDNLNDYYSVDLKFDRLKRLFNDNNFTFHKIDISEKSSLEFVFKKYKIDYVINLAAQAGVRYSITNPDAYINSNVIGFYNVLELVRKYKVKHLLYASSSSVYGNELKAPFEVDYNITQPLSFYAATKVSNEVMAHSYSNLYNIPITGLRFFTVYGPFGRPDMSYFKFADSYFNNKPIKIFNNGDFENDLERDFTYIDDVVDGVVMLLDKEPSEHVKHKVYNIGNNKPVKLMDFIKTLEDSLTYVYDKKIVFKKEFEPIKEGDVRMTCASLTKLQNVIDFKPKTTIKDGLLKFSLWYKTYYCEKKEL